MAIPAQILRNLNAIGNLIDRSFNDLNIVDKILVAPGFISGKYLLPKISDPQSTFEVSLMANVSFRVLILIQTVISATVLPFKMIITAVQFLYLLNGGSNIGGALRSFLPVLLHAIEIPFGIVGTFMPQSALTFMSTADRVGIAFLRGQAPTPADMQEVQATGQAIVQAIVPQIIAEAARLNLQAQMPPNFNFGDF